MYVQVVTFGLKGISEDEYRDGCQQETSTFASVPGLLTKIWLRDPESNTYGAVYLWRDREAYETYLKGDVWASVEGDESLTNVTSKSFGVIEELTSETQPGVTVV
jgi:quinol monooxygenase YgiN